MEEEIAAASGLKLDAYERGYTFFDEYINLKGMRQSMEGQILSSLGIDASNFTKAELREAFAQSTWVLDGAYDVSVDKLIADIETKYDGLKEDALGKIDNKYFVIERIGEIDENPEVSVVDWTNTLSVDKRFQGYLEEQDKLTEIIKVKEELLKSSEGSERTKLTEELAALYNRSDYLDTLYIDKEKAMNGNIKDMNLSQLTIRAEYDFMNMLRSFEQEVINDSLGWFDEALSKWEQGDDSDIRNLILDMYDGTKHLEDIKDFNELRNAYVQYAWEVGQYDEQLTERASHYILEDIGPYFLEKANYKETDNGYTLEIPPNFIDYAIGYAEEKEQDKKDLGDGIGIGGIATGFVVGLFSGGPIGAGIGLIISLASYFSGKAVKNAEDIWDDAINALKPYAGTGETIILDVNEKDDDVIPIVKEE